MEKYLVTGGEYISLPKITSNGEIQAVSFLHAGIRGLYYLDGAPFLRPVIERNGQRIFFDGLQEEKLGFWIPQFSASDAQGAYMYTILTPIDSKGFLLRVRYTNKSSHPQTIKLAFEGQWENTTREINESDCVCGQKSLRFGWHDAPMYALNGVLPLFCFSFLCDEKTQNRCTCSEQTAAYQFQRTLSIAPEESADLTLAVGFGIDGVSAVTNALHLLRQGFEKVMLETQRFLQKRIRTTGNAHVDWRLYYNLFFCYFFACGKTLDTETFVSVTSRSPRYYVSAAYWDRDTLLWAFPAILSVDTQRARDVLFYAFTTQLKNVGEHSRFIDGTVLEPGFELDELAAPLIALCNYCEKTGVPLWKQAPFSEGISKILALLQSKKHANVYLYQTFLYPSDDMHELPYLTYDNALVAHALSRLATLLRDENLLAWSKKIRQAVYKHCIAEKDGKRMFVWCIDLNGNAVFYDEPPGSLVLLSHLGICDKTDEAYQNTVEWLYSSDYAYGFLDKPFSQPGCAHAEHPWVLSYCNAVLANLHTDDAVTQMLDMQMDNGLACESVNEYTGEAETGEAFATCAGLYAYALMRVFQ